MKKTAILLAGCTLTTSAFAMEEASPQTSMRVYENLTASQAQCTLNTYLNNAEGESVGVLNRVSCQPTVNCSPDPIILTMSGVILSSDGISEINVQNSDSSTTSHSAGNPFPINTSQGDSLGTCQFAGAMITATLKGSAIPDCSVTTPVPGGNGEVVVCGVAIPMLGVDFSVKENTLEVTINSKPQNYNSNVFWAKIDSAVESCTEK